MNRYGVPLTHLRFQAIVCLYQTAKFENSKFAVLTLALSSGCQWLG